MQMPEELVLIPCSSKRNSSLAFAKLLSRVSPDAENGFGFEGTLLRPGHRVPWTELWPTPDHPKIPILLECAGAASGKAASGWRRHGQEDLYILWRFDPVDKKWRELGRSVSDSWTWAIDLRPLAIRAIEESKGTAVEVFADFMLVIQRLQRLLDLELDKLPHKERGRAIAVLHDELCSRLLRVKAVGGWIECS
jgi:hypothetical protein